MRIDAYNQVAQIYGTKRTAKVNTTQQVSMGRDQVQISSNLGRDLRVAKQAVSDASDIREDKVAELKARYASDNYQVDTGDFASKLLEKFNAAF
ncbi:MAG TPA: flagellar biosynthesis anti-sigma factor FlgM [Lachnospiraceae bacterium]|jgi:negative regulator of flagellin synthesis FlgM|nr:flagellar biosynthesis anti-sigma factor FlgM [Lachnospiraceae bacterium]MDY5703895.1 flagellar biosynthesis anti-sigma factor FlgM [Lachnospiraceae bacterium]MEE3357867.1 flagellar biosynthesis anti-sigma factor FlgM [Lachnospiraceae bacterium]HAN51046.1 flagellar biosynthesis anti-sigma factor FlgM [Lachnospiraceae bacterium]HBE08868.1 flagellar biosynthesis anti-sigma factor FlgM [Lachnospiraceae bacterium]